MPLPPPPPLLLGGGSGVGADGGGGGATLATGRVLPSSASTAYAVVTGVKESSPLPCWYSKYPVGGVVVAICNDKRCSLIVLLAANDDWSTLAAVRAISTHASDEASDAVPHELCGS